MTATHDTIVDAEIIDALPDQLGPRSTTAELVVRHAGAIISPVATVEETRDAFERYLELKRVIVVESDKTRIQGKEFTNKSGWRKLAVVMGVSSAILVREYDRDELGRVIRAEVIVRATAPNGRYMDGLGACDYRERCCPLAYAESAVCKQGGRHVHCVPGCDGWIHFSKPQHDIPATASTRALNRACSDLFGFGEVSAEEVTDQAEPATPEEVGALIDAMNAIEGDSPIVAGDGSKVPLRAFIKRKFVEQFGRPEQLTKGDLPAARRFITANGGKVPDPAPAPEKPTTGEVPSDGSRAVPAATESSGSDEGGGAAVGTAAPPPEPLPREWPATPLLDKSPEAEHDWLPKGPRATAPPAPPKPSSAQQRRSVGMKFRELVSNGIVRDTDKAELVGILTESRVSSMADTNYDEAVKIVAASAFLESGDLAFADDPVAPGERGLKFMTTRGQDFLRPWLVDPNEEPVNAESDRQTCDECGRTWVGGDVETHTPGCPNGAD